MTAYEVFMSELICNAPFCLNPRNYNHGFCGMHRWERKKYKIKVYKELLPLWCAKRCAIHGLLRHNQVRKNFTTNQKTCLFCQPKVPYCPVKNKQKMIKNSVYRKEARLKKRYKINMDDYHLMLVSQDNKCALCNNIN